MDAAFYNVLNQTINTPTPESASMKRIHNSVGVNNLYNADAELVQAGNLLDDQLDKTDFSGKSNAEIADLFKAQYRAFGSKLANNTAKRLWQDSENDAFNEFMRQRQYAAYGAGSPMNAPAAGPPLGATPAQAAPSQPPQQPLTPFTPPTNPIPPSYGGALQAVGQQPPFGAFPPSMPTGAPPFPGLQPQMPTEYQMPQAAAPYQAMVEQAAAKYGFPAPILYELLQQESSYNPNAVSSAGAQGIAQFMPDTAAEYGVNPMNPASAIDGAARYLSDLLGQYDGDMNKALAAYNGGMGRLAGVGGDIGRMPDETQNYVASITSRANGGEREEAARSFDTPLPQLTAEQNIARERNSFNMKRLVSKLGEVEERLGEIKDVSSNPGGIMSLVGGGDNTAGKQRATDNLAQLKEERRLSLIRVEDLTRELHDHGRERQRKSENALQRVAELKAKLSQLEGETGGDIAEQNHRRREISDLKDELASAERVNAYFNIEELREPNRRRIETMMDRIVAEKNRAADLAEQINANKSVPDELGKYRGTYTPFNFGNEAAVQQIRDDQRGELLQEKRALGAEIRSILEEDNDFIAKAMVENSNPPATPPGQHDTLVNMSEFAHGPVPGLGAFQKQDPPPKVPALTPEPELPPKPVTPAMPAEEAALGGGTPTSTTPLTAPTPAEVQKTIQEQGENERAEMPKAPVIKNQFFDLRQNDANPPLPTTGERGNDNFLQDAYMLQYGYGKDPMKALDGMRAMQAAEEQNQAKILEAIAKMQGKGGETARWLYEKQISPRIKEHNSLTNMFNVLDVANEYRDKKARGEDTGPLRTILTTGIAATMAEAMRTGNGGFFASAIYRDVPTKTEDLATNVFNEITRILTGELGDEEIDRYIATMSYLARGKYESLYSSLGDSNVQNNIGEGQSGYNIVKRYTPEVRQQIVGQAAPNVDTAKWAEQSQTLIKQYPTKAAFVAAGLKKIDGKGISPAQARKMLGQTWQAAKDATKGNGLSGETSAPSNDELNDLGLN